MPVANPFEPEGGGGSVNLKQENLTSQCNGSAQSFTISVPYKAATLQVYWNGLQQTPTEITEDTQTTFSTDFTPTNDDNLIVIFIEK